MAVRMSSFIFLSALFASMSPSVSSSPLGTSGDDLEARGLSTCAVVSDVLSILHNPVISASATKFCSSFISIPLSTTTSVSTATVTPASVTTTSTVTVFTTTSVTSTLGLPVTTFPPPANKEKRAGNTLPPYVSAYGSSKVSAACSCLSITPSVTTVKSTGQVTASASTVTVTTTSTSTQTSTSTVLGVASQCLPAAISASPVSLSHPGVEAIAGTAQQVGSNFPINNLQDCCSACYLATSNCVAFTYGNFDNEAFPAQLDNPSNVNTCRIYRDGFGDCKNDVSIFTPPQQPLSGEVNNFGIGPCTPDTS